LECSTVSSALELDVGSGQARVIAGPPGRDLRRAIRWLAIRRFLLAGLALCVGLIAAWYGYRWWTVGRFIQITDDAYVGGEVTVIAPKVAGLIAEVPVTDNQDVRAGDLLVRLDDPTTEPLLPRRSGLLPPKRQLSPISVPPAILRNR
jgi:hypothetical protein